MKNLGNRFDWRLLVASSVIVIATLLIAFVLYNNSGRVTSSGEPGPMWETPAVSVINLIAAPDEFNGKRVFVMGYLRIKFEGTALYLDETHSDYTLTKNAVAVSFSSGMGSLAFLAKSYDSTYCAVEGVFNANEKGHMGLFSGMIEDISFIARLK